MHRTASISAYDVLGDVWVTGTVVTRDGLTDSVSDHRLTVSVQVKGTGEGDTARWLRDALVALAETL